MKEIKMSLINKIKHLQEKAFEYGEDENRRGEKNCENAIDRLTKDYYGEEKYEIYHLIIWTNDDCASALEKAGWKVIRGE